MRKQTKKPVSLGEVLKIYFRDNGLKGKLEEQKILDIWEAVVGDAVATRTQPIRVKNRVLYVTVSNSVWMQQLHFMKELIIKKLNERTGSDFLQDLRFFFGEIEHLKQADEKKRENNGGDIVTVSEPDRERIEKEVSQVKDPEIRKILMKVYLKGLAAEGTRKNKRTK
ncbi:MAG: DUF721 domain-containing protein [Thermodesulfobacteriota bacterium]|nr:DUF721 domain-containing protein [Thermodesulfobacteriota bacterium]